MAKKKGHPGLIAGAGSLNGALIGGFGGAALGYQLGGPAGAAAGDIVGTYGGAVIGGDQGVKMYARQHHLSDKKTEEMRQYTAVGNVLAPVLGGGVLAHVAAPERRKMKAGSAGIASYHAEKDIAKMRSARHPSYYTRRQHGKLQRVKYSYRDSRNPFNNEF